MSSNLKVVVLANSLLHDRHKCSENILIITARNRTGVNKQCIRCPNSIKFQKMLVMLENTLSCYIKKNIRNSNKNDSLDHSHGTLRFIETPIETSNEEPSLSQKFQIQRLQVLFTLLNKSYLPIL